MKWNNVSSGATYNITQGAGVKHKEDRVLKKKKEHVCKHMQNMEHGQLNIYYLSATALCVVTPESRVFTLTRDRDMMR